jgi:hypothetical protein
VPCNLYDHAEKGQAGRVRIEEDGDREVGVLPGVPQYLFNVQPSAIVANPKSTIFTSASLLSEVIRRFSGFKSL